jgi:uncharacterized membrane protein HdeD (DUF308 family)
MDLDERVMGEEAAKWWWVFLATGIVWLLIGLVVLRFDTTSITTVGFLIGGLFVVGALNEAMEASAANGGWKFLHYTLAVIFVFGAVWSFINPLESFYSLASILGFVLLFMGTFEIMRSVASRAENPMWGLGLAVGILEILLAIWVSQRFFPARAELMLFWVGFMSIFRGFGQIVLAFGVRKVGKELATAA